MVQKRGVMLMLRITMLKLGEFLLELCINIGLYVGVGAYINFKSKSP
jgi:hypothetical protein